MKLGKACETCPYRDRPGPVPASGDKGTAALVLVGEAPGEDEVAVNMPMVGQAGRELWKLAGAAGFYRPQVYMTNVVKCLPIGAEQGKYEPDEKAIESCVGYLKKEIQECRTNVVVPLGNVATAVIAGKWGILGIRGASLRRRLKS